ncbi:MAG TPA: hypothetical protein VEN30_17040, partial [Paraburkholderia sp.]|nr:hypothetical protein [Paraburkholderia sp.]
ELQEGRCRGWLAPGARVVQATWGRLSWRMTPEPQLGDERRAAAFAEEKRPLPLSCGNGLLPTIRLELAL